MRPLHTFVIVDPVGSWLTTAEEVEDIIKTLSNWGLQTRLVGHDVDARALVNIYPNDIDLLVLDYGGVSSGYGWDTVFANLSYLLNWVSDHPGKILLVWTGFTRSILESDEFSAFRELENVLFAKPPAFQYLSGREEIEMQNKLCERIRFWMGDEDEDI